MPTPNIYTYVSNNLNQSMSYFTKQPMFLKSVHVHKCVRES